MTAFQWVNLFTAGGWDVYVRWSGTSSSVELRDHFVRADLVDPAVLRVAVVGGQLVLEPQDAPLLDGDNGQTQPAVLLVPRAGTPTGQLRVTVDENVDMVDDWLSASMRLVSVESAGIGMLDIAETGWKHDYASAESMESLVTIGVSNSAMFPALLIEQVGKEFSNEYKGALVLTNQTDPYIHAYRWTDSVGFGSKYAGPVRTVTTGLYPPNGFTFSNDGSRIFLTGSGTRDWSVNQLTGWPWSKASGFGTQYSAPDILTGLEEFPAQGRDVAQLKSGETQHLVYLTNQAPWIYLYPLADDAPAVWAAPIYTMSIFSGWGGGAKQLYDVDCHPTTRDVAWGANTTPFVYALRVKDDPVFNNMATFHSPPATLPALGSVNAVKFSPTGGALLLGGNANEFLGAYRWSNGFGAQYSSPSPALPGYVSSRALEFSPDGSVVFVGHFGSPFISAYAWSDASGFGVKYSNPATLPPGTVLGVACSPAGGAVAVTFGNTSPYYRVYRWDNQSGFGAVYSGPDVAPGSSYTYQPKFSPWV